MICAAISAASRSPCSNTGHRHNLDRSVRSCAPQSQLCNQSERAQSLAAKKKLNLTHLLVYYSTLFPVVHFSHASNQLAYPHYSRSIQRIHVGLHPTPEQILLTSIQKLRGLRAKLLECPGARQLTSKSEDLAIKHNLQRRLFRPLS